MNIRDCFESTLTKMDPYATYDSSGSHRTFEDLATAFSFSITKSRSKSRGGRLISDISRPTTGMSYRKSNNISRIERYSPSPTNTLRIPASPQPCSILGTSLMRKDPWHSQASSTSPTRKNLQQKQLRPYEILIRKRTKLRYPALRESKCEDWDSFKVEGSEKCRHLRISSILNAKSL